MGPTSNSNQFFGVKVSQIGVKVQNASDSQLIYKSNFSTNLFNGPNGIWKVMEGTRTPNTSNGLTNPQFGFWVSEDNVDVTLATDDQMVFNSDGNTNVSRLVNPVSFLAYFSGTFEAGVGNQVLPMNVLVYDVGQNYNVNTGYFTAPINGLYLIGGGAQYIEAASGQSMITSLGVSGQYSEIRFQEIVGNGTNLTQSGSVTIPLSAGQLVALQVRGPSTFIGQSSSTSLVTYMYGSLQSAIV